MSTVSLLDQLILSTGSLPHKKCSDIFVTTGTAGTKQTIYPENTPSAFHGVRVPGENTVYEIRGWWPINTLANSTANQKEEKKETAMSLEQNQIDYLTRRVSEVYRDLRSPLSDKFNLYKDNTPKTYKELIDAIKNDKFKLNEKRIKFLEADENEEIYPFGPFDGIIWDGPQADWDGYNAACDKLCKARQATLDIISTSSASEGLKALQEFQKWTPEGAAN